MSFPAFQIKVCGITSAADAQACVEAGVDALGLNFYPRSSRHVTSDQAEAIVAVAGDRIVKVGVFVNATAPEIRALYERLGLDLVQLHGDESPEFVADLAGLPIMRAFRCSGDLSPIEEYLDRCRKLQAPLAAVLIDAHRPGQYGGTGEVADWEAISASRDALGGLPLVLAGGLTPDNVAAGIAAVRPAAVDTASGVESSPGRKSAVLVRAFADAARVAFAAHV